MNFQVGTCIVAVGIAFGLIPIGLDLVAFGELRTVWMPVAGLIIVAMGVARILFVDRGDRTGITWYGPNGEVEKNVQLKPAPWKRSRMRIKNNVATWRFWADSATPIDWKRLRKEAIACARERNCSVWEVDVRTAAEWNGRMNLGVERAIHVEQPTYHLRWGGWVLTRGWQKYVGPVHVRVAMVERVKRQEAEAA